MTKKTQRMHKIITQRIEIIETKKAISLIVLAELDKWADKPINKRLATKIQVSLDAEYGTTPKTPEQLKYNSDKKKTWSNVSVYYTTSEFVGDKAYTLQVSTNKLVKKMPDIKSPKGDYYHPDRDDASRIELGTTHATSMDRLKTSFDFSYVDTTGYLTLLAHLDNAESAHDAITKAMASYNEYVNSFGNASGVISEVMGRV